MSLFLVVGGNGVLCKIVYYFTEMHGILYNCTQGCGVLKNFSLFYKFFLGFIW